MDYWAKNSDQHQEARGHPRSRLGIVWDSIQETHHFETMAGSKTCILTRGMQENDEAVGIPRS
jgi:hypothetical protein